MIKKVIISIIVVIIGLVIGLNHVKDIRDNQEIICKDGVCLPPDQWDIGEN